MVLATRRTLSLGKSDDRRLYVCMLQVSEVTTNYYFQRLITIFAKFTVSPKVEEVPY